MAAEKIRDYAPDDKAGAIIVGSHIKKTAQQLTRISHQDGIQGIEIDVAKISTQRARLLKDIFSDVEDCHSKNITPVIYTSRTELQFEDQESHLAFAEQISIFDECSEEPARDDRFSDQQRRYYFERCFE